MNPIKTFDSSADVLPHIVLDINQKQYQPRFLDFLWWPPSCFSINMESQWPFESADYGFGEAGRRAQSWLVTCSSFDNTLSIWAPSSRLALKRRLLMGRRPEESCGIGKGNPAQEQMQHTSKYYTKINVLSSRGPHAWESSVVILLSMMSLAPEVPFKVFVGVKEQRVSQQSISSSSRRWTVSANYRRSGHFV